MHIIMVIHASHASSINKFMNSKLKLLNCNANIHFNRTCLERNLTPKYAHIKINSHYKTIINHTETQTRKIRLRNEIKFLYATKQGLSNQGW
jgi:hypothetical protein